MWEMVREHRKTCFGDLKLLGTGIKEVGTEKVRQERCLTCFLFLTITNDWNVA